MKALLRKKTNKEVGCGCHFKVQLKGSLKISKRILGKGTDKIHGFLVFEDNLFRNLDSASPKEQDSRIPVHTFDNK